MLLAEITETGWVAIIAAIGTAASGIIAAVFAGVVSLRKQLAEMKAVNSAENAEIRKAQDVHHEEVKGEIAQVKQAVETK